jgi:hypothetical protein
MKDGKVKTVTLEEAIKDMTSGELERFNKEDMRSS